MRTLFTKKFFFSASHEKGDRVLGHNYVLGVVTGSLNDSEETTLEHAVQRALIDKIDARDLGLHVDFLKDTEINELNLLKSFWNILEPEIRPLILSSLFLEKDGRSKVALSKDP